jgi:GMP synthase-like glutamine amidotransferase
VSRLPASESGSHAVGGSGPRSSIERVLVLQHDDDTDIALIGIAAEASGAALDVRHPTRESLPKPGDYDAIVVLGSADSVNDPAIAPWFDAEVELIRQADAASIPVFGICFGAQALAVALGGSVERAPYGEYGWKMVDTTEPTVVPEGPWFQWHVDAIVPPPNAAVIATSDCSVQAYRIGPHLAVQFHPEVTTKHANEWPASDPDGLAASGLSALDMVEITESLLPDATKRAEALWEAFVTHANENRNDKPTA